MQRPPLHPVAMIARFFAGIVGIAIGALQGLFWWLVSALRCDEGCDEYSSSWHQNPDAWQWSALGLLGAGCFALCVAFAISLATPRPRVSAALLAAAALVGTVPWILS
jgi:hypothetical protein